MALENLGNLDHETADAVRELLEINIDSSKGFRQAADTIEDERTAGLFREFAQQRERFAHELRDTLQVARVEIEEKGSALGAAHRWWLDLRGKLAGGDAGAVLDEAERGENHITEKYERVLPRVAGNPLNDVLLEQYAEIKRARDRIHALRDTERAS